MRWRESLGRLVLVAVAAPAFPADAPAPEPRAFSAFPFGGQRGTTVRMTVRGVSLAQTAGVWFAQAPLLASIVSIAREPSPARSPAKPAPPLDLVQMDVRIAEDAAPGEYPFRLMTSRGLTNELRFHVTAEPAAVEPAWLERLPAEIFGRLALLGETDSYEFEAQAGQELWFVARAGVPGFDPALALFEPAGSWFDAGRWKRIAYHDEPLSYPGRSTDARLRHRFARQGRYLLRVEAFQGISGPDSVYRLTVSPAEPRPPVSASGHWNEREFTRPLSPDWMARVAGRGRGGGQPAMETYQAADESEARIPEMKLPALVQGVIREPGLIQRIRFRVDQPQELALEIETPRETMPIFNPVVRVLDAEGREAVTNVYTKRNNNGLYMMKMIEPKTVFGMPAAGEYTLEIRDLTPDHGGESFAYRVCVRPRLPHLGKVTFSETHLNLAPGEVKPVTVLVEREEGYQDLLLVQAENLPAGVQALPGSAFDPPKPPLPNGGKLERYTPEAYRATLALTAAPDAPPLREPRRMQLVVRTVQDGKPGPVVARRELPLLVVENPVLTSSRETAERAR